MTAKETAVARRLPLPVVACANRNVDGLRVLNVVLRLVKKGGVIETIDSLGVFGVSVVRFVLVEAVVVRVDCVDELLVATKAPICTGGPGNFGFSWSVNVGRTLI